MKILAVILALSIVTGSQSLVIREAPDPPPKLEDLVKSFGALLWDVPFAITMQFYSFADTKTGKAVTDQTQQLIQSLPNLDEKSFPDITEAAEVVFGVPWNIAEKAYNTFKEIDRRASIDERNVIEVLSHYFDPMISRVSPYVHPLITTFESTVGETIEALNVRLRQALDSLDDQLSFYTKGLQEFREALQPLADNAWKQVRLGLETLNKNLKPYLKPFLEESRKYREEFLEWRYAPVFPPPKS